MAAPMKQAAIDATGIGGSRTKAKKPRHLKKAVKSAGNPSPQKAEIKPETRSALNVLAAYHVPSQLHGLNLSECALSQPLVEFDLRKSSAAAPVVEVIDEVPEEANELADLEESAEDKHDEDVPPTGGAVVTEWKDCSVLRNTNYDGFVGLLQSGNTKQAKSYLRYMCHSPDSDRSAHRNAIRPAEQDFVKGYLEDLKRVCQEMEPTEYGDLADQKYVTRADTWTDESWDKHNGAMCSTMFTKRRQSAVPVGKTAYKLKEVVDRVQVSLVTGYLDWFEFHTPITNKKGGPSQCLLRVTPSTPWSWVTTPQPVMIGGVQVGVRYERQRVQVPGTTMAEQVTVMAEARASTYYSQAARAGGDDSVIPAEIVRPVAPKVEAVAAVTMEAANDPPPWVEEPNAPVVVESIKDYPNRANKDFTCHHIPNPATFQEIEVVQYVVSGVSDGAVVVADSEEEANTIAGIIESMADQVFTHGGYREEFLKAIPLAERHHQMRLVQEDSDELERYNLWLLDRDHTSKLNAEAARYHDYWEEQARLDPYGFMSVMLMEMERKRPSLRYIPMTAPAQADETSKVVAPNLSAAVTRSERDRSVLSDILALGDTTSEELNHQLTKRVTSLDVVRHLAATYKPSEGGILLPA